jgi:hypothetical protein
MLTVFQPEVCRELQLRSEPGYPLCMFWWIRLLADGSVKVCPCVGLRRRPWWGRLRCETSAELVIYTSARLFTTITAHRPPKMREPTTPSLQPLRVVDVIAKYLVDGDRRLDHVSGPVLASSMLVSTQFTSMHRPRLSAPLDHLHSLEASQASFHGG